MELESLETIFKVDWSNVKEQLQKMQETFQQFGDLTANTAQQSMQKTEQAMDLSEGLRKIQEEIRQVGQTVTESFSKISEDARTGSEKVSLNTGKMFSGTKQQVGTDLQAVIDEINAKMQQARAAQAKMNDLIGQKSSLSAAQQNGSEGVKFDSQIATVQAQMTRYQNQAKALAQSMKGEFNAVPESLQRIAKAMDQNEIEIEAYRKRLNMLNESYNKLKAVMDVGTLKRGGLEKMEKQSISLQNSIVSVTGKMNKLISSSDSLNDAYTYVEKRGAALSGVVGTLNTELNEDSAGARRAATSMNEMGSAASRASRNISNMSGNNGSGFFSKIKSAISNATSSIKAFGEDSESSMNKASRSGRDYYGVINGIRIQLAFLPGQIIVFGLLYNGISKLATGMLSAFKTNTQFSSSLNQIQVNLLTAFYPIYTYVLPAVNAMMNALAKSTSYIAQFTAALFGMSNSAAKSGASSLYSQVKAMNDTSSASSSASKAIQEANKQINASNKANKEAVTEANKQITASNKAATASYEEQKAAAEELSGSLQGFDELNVLDSNQSNDITKPAAQSLETYTPQSLESTDSDNDSGDSGLNFNTPTTQFAGIQDTVNKLKKILGELFDPMQEAWNSKGKEVTEATKYAWEEVKRALEDVGTSFLHVWDNGTGEKTMELLLQLLADMLNIIGDIAKAFSEAWEGGGGRGTKLIQAVFDALNDVLGLINDIAKSFRSAFNDSDLGEKIIANILDILTDVFDVIGNFASQFDKAWQHGNTGTSIFKTLLGIVNDMLSALKDMADYTVKWSSKLDFSPLLQSIDNLLKAIRPIAKDVWDGVAWGYENVLLPLAKFTITELVPNFLNLLAAALKLVGSIINAAKPAFQWVWDSFLEPIAKWSGGVIIDVLKKLADALNSISDWVDKHQKAVETMAKVIMGIFAFKVSTSAFSKATGYMSTLVSGASDLAKNKTVLKEFFGKITGISDLKDGVSNIKDLAKMSWNGIKTGAGYVVDMWTAMKNWSIWGKLAAAAQAILNAAMDLNPYVLLAAAIAAVVVGLVALYKHDKKFQKFCNDLYKSIAKWLGNAIKWLEKNWGGVALLIVNPIAGGLVLLYDNNPKFQKWVDDLWTGLQKNLKSFKKNWGKFWDDVGDKLSTIWDDMKTDTKEKWGKIKDHITTASEDAWKDAKGSWDTLKDKTSTAWNDIKTGTSNKWDDVKKYVSGKAEDAHKGASSAWDNIKSHTSDVWSNVSDGTHSTWQSIHDKISNMSDQAKTKALTAWQSLQDNTPGYFRNIKGYASDAWTTITQGAGGLGSNIASGIRSGFQFVQDAMSDLKKYIIDPVKSAVNKIKDGINWVLNKLGAGSTNWGWFNWANGTANHPGGLAMVNDENSSNYRESYQLPNGKQGIFPAVRNLVLPLPAGTQIKSAAATRASISKLMPHYAGGIGDFNFDFSGLEDALKSLSSIDWSSLGGDIWSGVTDEFDSILSDVTHPKKLLDYMVNKFMSYDWGWTDTQTKLAKGSVNTLEDGLTSWAKNILKKFGSASGGTIPSGNHQSLMKEAGIPSSWFNDMNWLVTTESGWKTNATNPSSGAYGLPQSLPGSKMASAGSDWRTNPVTQLKWMYDYVSGRYGTAANAVRFHKINGWYANGGFVDAEGLYGMAEGNKPEMVLPLTDKNRTLQLIKEAMSYIGENFTSGLQMPTALTADTGAINTEVSANSNSSANATVQSGGISQLSTNLVNAIVQGLQMATGSSTDSNQPININLTVNMDSDQLGQAAIKGINSVNAKNHRNMLNL